MSDYHAPKECHCRCHVSNNLCCEKCAPKDLDLRFMCFAMRERIEKLEESIIELINWKEVSINKNIEYDQRMKDIETFIQNTMIHVGNANDAIHAALSEMMDIKKSAARHPYKCPVCDGKRGTIISGTIDEYCDVCEGKGVLWG